MAEMASGEATFLAGFDYIDARTETYGGQTEYPDLIVHLRTSRGITNTLILQCANPELVNDLAEAINRFSRQDVPDR